MTDLFLIQLDRDKKPIATASLDSATRYIKSREGEISIDHDKQNDSYDVYKSVDYGEEVHQLGTISKIILL